MLNRNKLSHKINYEVLQGLFGSADAAGAEGADGGERRQSPGAVCDGHAFHPDTLALLQTWH